MLSVNRGLYKHYGVYVGDDTVVHFSGGKGHELSAKRACIRKTSLEDFSSKGEVQIETKYAKAYSREETVRRALEAVGSEKGKYSLVWNNCEHFASWCRYGKKRSVQVENFCAGLACVSAVVLGSALLEKLNEEVLLTEIA